MTVDELVAKHASNKEDEEWIRRMISLMMVSKKHANLKQVSRS